MPSTHTTIKELSDLWGISDYPIRQAISELFPGMLRNGIVTLLTEKEASLIKEKLLENKRINLDFKNEVTTESDDDLIIIRGLQAAQRKIEKLQQENAAMLPKANYYNALVSHEALTNLRDTAKQIGLKQNDFISRLLADGYIYKNQNGFYRPTSKQPELFELKDFITNKDFHEKQTFITVEGKNYFLQKYGRSLICK